MRKSRQEAAETRKRIVHAASVEFRRDGIGATGLADLMSAAGLTHGGFYRHFESKDQLVAEVCSEAFAETAKDLATAIKGRRGRKALQATAAKYLSTSHRDDPGTGCPLASLGSEIARCNKRTRSEATTGISNMVETIAGQLEENRPAHAKRQALVALSTMVGALTLSRIVDDPALSRLILREAEKHIAESSN